MTWLHFPSYNFYLWYCWVDYRILFDIQLLLLGLSFFCFVTDTFILILLHKLSSLNDKIHYFVFISMGLNSFCCFCPVRRLFFNNIFFLHLYSDLPRWLNSQFTLLFHGLIGLFRRLIISQDFIFLLSFWLNHLFLRLSLIYRLNNLFLWLNYLFCLFDCILELFGLLIFSYQFRWLDWLFASYDSLFRLSDRFGYMNIWLGVLDGRLGGLFDLLILGS